MWVKPEDRPNFKSEKLHSFMISTLVCQFMISIIIIIGSNYLPYSQNNIENYWEIEDDW